MAVRIFTLEEADKLLDRVRPLAERLVRHRRELVAAQAERTELALSIAGNGGGVDTRRLAELDDEIAQALAGVARCVNGIHELGAQVKDLDEGLVDFPSLRDGREVLLCWRVGEDGIAYWHEVDEGFAGRKALDED